MSQGSGWKGANDGDLAGIAVNFGMWTTLWEWIFPFVFLVTPSVAPYLI